MSDAVSRRRFLATTAGAFALSPVLAACGGGDGGGVVAANCEGYGALTATELQQRAALNYVDVTPIPTEMCSNCQFYVAAESGAACGGCQLFAGPVAPNGYCTGWVAAAA